jgi:uncharacterized membrane protein
MKIKENYFSVFISLLLSWQLNVYSQSINESCPILRSIDSEEVVADLLELIMEGGSVSSC